MSFLLKDVMEIRTWKAVCILCAAVFVLFGLSAPCRAETGVTNTISGNALYSSLFMVGTNGAFNALIVTNGGLLTVNATSIIGNSAASSNNYAVVTGAGSIWSNNTSALYVGNTGSFNSLSVANKGALFNTFGYIGFYASSSNNTVLVTGPGSVWSNSSELNVGYNGFGNSLTITNSGTVFDTFGTIGYSGSNNTVLVTGPGSVWNNSSAFYAGYSGSSNSLTIANGGQVFNSFGVIGWFAGARNNAVTVTDPGSVWSNSGYVYVGYNGSSNHLSIANSGMVAATNVVIGYSASTGNVITITGGSLYVTNTTGTSALDIRYGTLGFTGGVIIADSLWMTNNVGTTKGVFNFAAGTLTTLTNSTIVTRNQDFVIGSGTAAGQTGTWNIVGGVARMQLGGGGTIIGNNAAGNGVGIVNVTGAGSLWSNSGSLYVGYSGSSNSLTIANGGTVLSVTGFVGFASTANNNLVSVNGSGSVWSNSSYVYVGDNGSFSNQLVLASGTLFAASILVAPSNSLSGYGTVSVVGDKLVNSGLVAALTSGQTLAFNSGVLNAGMLSATNGGILDFHGPVLNLGSTNFAGGQAIFRSLFLSSGLATNDWASTGDGNWSEAARWSLGQTPSNAVQSYICLTNALNKTVTVNAATLAAAPWSVTNFSVTISAPLGGTNILKVDNTGAGQPFMAVNLSVGSGGLLQLTNAALTVGMLNYGALTVDGELRADNAIVAVTNGASMVVGLATQGIFRLNNSTLQATQIILGASPTGSGMLLLTGTLTTVTGNLNVGLTGSVNQLVIGAGSVLNDQVGYIGNNTNSSNNTVVVTGPGSAWGNSSYLYVGNSSPGNSLTIANGGLVTNTSGNIGMSASANNNSVVVTDLGSVWSNGALTVGAAGSFNSLTVANSGVVIAGSTYIGSAASASNNSVLVTGAGSVLSNSTVVYIGSSGSGNSLTIANGGLVINNGNSVVGNQASSSNNTVLVTGAGSVWRNNNAGLSIGSIGSGNSLIISNGGQVLDLGPSGEAIGVVANNNSVVVTGTGSFWRINSGLNVGYSGYGNTLTITNGGQVYVAGTTIGNELYSNAVVVTGAGSVWSNGSGNLVVGLYSFGNSLTIANSGQVFNASLAYVGGTHAGASNNSALVTGASSLWSNAASLCIGYYDSYNSMTIANGGTVLSATGFVGYASTANNNLVSVSGTGSLWNNASNLFVGYQGANNQLLIANGGTVLSLTGLVGFATSASNNFVSVSGSGSLWNNSSDFYVGNAGSFNQLTIGDSGTVYNANGWVGYSSSANSNAVLVTGVGSVWSNSGNLTIGVASAGNQLTITNGGVVRTRGSFTLGVNNTLLNSASGLLYLGGNFDNQATNQPGNDFSGTFIFNGSSGGGSCVTQTVEVASGGATAGLGGTTNFYFGSFQVGDATTGSNAWVQLVDNRVNTTGGGNETFGASNLIVALAQSVLDLNNRTSFVGNLINAGTLLQTNASPPGVVTRLDVVNTFTNTGTVLIGNGSVLQFSNAFINAGLVRLQNGGVLTNFISGSVLTNSASACIIGNGVIAALVGNGGTITASGGVLQLTGGFTNNAAGTPVNAGLLAVQGAGSVLNVGEAFINVGSIQLSNATAVLTATSVTNAGSIMGYGIFNAALNNTGGVTNNNNNQTLIFAQSVNNNAGGAMTVLNGGGLWFSNAVANAGAITVQDQSTATFVAAVTNTGTITAQNQSLLTFNAGLTNNGTLAYGPAVNPSTAIISGSLTLGSSGIITMWNTNDTLVVQGNFVNGSTNNNSFNMTNSVMVFGAAGGLTTNTFEVAGRNLGTNFAGFNYNFAVGTLNITNGIRFVDYVNNGGGGNSNEVLYVDVLHLFNGAT